MLAATSYPLLEVFWTMLIFFAFFIWIWLLITVFMDIFRRQDIGGWGKTAWIIFVIILPYLGVFVYLIAEHKGMTERAIKDQQQAKTQMDDYVRSVAGQTDPPRRSPAPRICSTRARSRRPSSTRSSRRRSPEPAP